MILDAIFAYLHYTAIFILFAFISVAAIALREPLDAAGIRRMVRLDLWTFGSAMAALATGMLRLVWGAKGAEFYLSSWPFFAKVGLFLAIAGISIGPTLTFVRWRRMLDHDAGFVVPEAEQKKIRRIVMVQLHLAALIPVFAVMMARGLGR